MAAACAVWLSLAVLSPGQAQTSETNKPDWFKIEALNSGLGDAPESVDRTTPQDTVDSFLELTRGQNFAAAAHLLDLGEFPPGEQAARGAHLARKLAEVIERRLVVDWTEIPSRPDAMVEDPTGRNPMAGKPRRSVKIAILDTGGRPSTIRLNRLKPADGEPAWVFARQTVSDIPRLHERFGPGWFESKLPYEWKQQVSGVRAWEFLGLPLLILAAAVMFGFLRQLMGIVGRAVPFKWINRTANGIRTPMALAATALILQSLVNWLLTFSGPISTVLTPVLWMLIIFGLTFAALKVVDAFLEVVTERYVSDINDRYSSDKRRLYTNIYGLRRFILLVAVLVSIVLMIWKFNAFGGFGLSLLASAGITTVILGIAGQTVLGNILASLQIAIAKPIRIGDSVQYEGNWAYVEAIYYTHVILTTWDDRRLIVPVQYFISRPFENWTITDAKSTRTFSLRLDHTAEPAVLREVFERLAREDEDAMQDEMLMVTVEDAAEYSQEVRFYATAANPTDAWLMHARLREQMSDWVRQNHPEWWPRMRLGQEQPAGDSGRLRDVSA